MLGRTLHPTLSMLGMLVQASVPWHPPAPGTHASGFPETRTGSAGPEQARVSTREKLGDSRCNLRHSFDRRGHQ